MSQHYPPTLRASAQGKQAIKTAIKDKEWKIDAWADDTPLREATLLLEPDRRQQWKQTWASGDRIYATGLSPATWKKYVQSQQRIKAEAFITFWSTFSWSFCSPT